MSGTLYIVATPIGNLKDISFRALEILPKVDYILCEDTRVTGKLLFHYQISKPLKILTDFNEAQKISQILSDLKDGRDVALVSDSGTPLVSDPGFKLIREAIACDLQVVTIPGPTAAVAALTVSGLPPDKFIFLGFLPKKHGKKIKLLDDLKKTKQIMKLTVIIYESPFRLRQTLVDTKDVFGDIPIVICRELTKMHEEIRREEISKSLKHFTETKPKGEFVILL